MIPGVTYKAIVSGRETEIYLTLQDLDVDGVAKYRYAKGTPMEDKAVDPSEIVEVVEMVCPVKDGKATTLRRGGLYTG